MNDQADEGFEAGRRFSPLSEPAVEPERGLKPRATSILFLLTGSIAGYKACDAVSRLVQRGHRVRVVMTAAARKFVGEATLEGLTGERVLTDIFEAGAALEHIELTRWAEAVVVCPATAHTLNRAAAGLGDDLAGALLLAHDWKKPLIFAPAMNPAMWAHPATRASVEKLTAWGARFVPVGEGRTACGEMGEGRLAEPETIVEFVEAALAEGRNVGRKARPTVERLRVLVTSGGTSEPVDGVRVLTNTSTGATGALIAERLARSGHAVTLLRAENAVRASRAEVGGEAVREETFSSFASLDVALGRLLGAEEFDVVIHAAAVGDFSVEAIEVDGVARAATAGKIDSGGEVVLRLRRNPKLVVVLRERSKNAAVRVVAFKLTRGASEAEARTAVEGLFARGGVDFVVHNDLAVRAAGGAFPATIWGAAGVVERCAGREELAEKLTEILVGIF